MKGMTVDYEINAIAESPILDFFPYFKEEGQDIPDNLRPLEVEKEEVEQEME
jgi:hypothetical protein